MPDAEENYTFALDEEWVELIASAHNMGMSLEEIRLFIRTVVEDDTHSHR